MGKPFWRSVEYFFTGNYSADNGNNNIVAIGFGGEIHAYGGDDHVTLGSIGATVHTGSGNDTVVGGAAYMRIEDSSGDLSVKGAAGYADINKSGDGHLSFAGAAGGVTMDHTGSHGNLRYGGVAAYNGLTRKGKTGNVTFEGAGGYNSLWHETNQGNLYYAGAGAGNKLDRTWFDRYQGSTGNVSFNGAGAANSISSRVESGHITFKGAGADNHLVRKGKYGNISLQGAGASNRIERVRQADDVYVETHGDIRFEGVGGYNRLYSDVAHGDIRYSGAGAYNEITRKGAGNDIDGEGLRFADASDIVLTNATLGGSWIAESQQVSGVKYSREPNTYLFAFADETYTKISKVQLRNDPQTGELKYYATSWYKEGNLLDGLASREISSGGGFTEVNINGAYTLSNLTVEKQQSVTVHAVEENLTEYEWVTYANGAIIDADNISLSDAKLSGSAIYQDGTKVDVKAVKSNRNPNTYIYAKKFSVYTKIVVVELANDPETGVLKYQAKAWYKEGDHTADLANQDISAANGYSAMGKGGYSLSDLHYSVNAVRSTSERVADLDEYTENTLIKPSTDSGESSGDVHFNGAGGGNVIKSNVTRGNVYFNGGGIANVILHHSRFGDTEFNGGGAANVIVKSGEQGDLRFRGAGLANVLVHQSQQGKMDVYAGGAVNVLVRIGDGEYLAHLLAYGNISVHKGSGKSRVVMLGGYNTHTQVGDGNGVWLGAGGFNVMTQVGRGNLASVLVGGANVLTKIGDGDLTSGMVGGANIITHVSSDSASSNTTSVALGGANILTKKGKGNTLAVMGGGANVLTHVGEGNTTGIMVGGANILTKVGDGDTTGVMLGIGNVLTHVGDGQTLGVMGAVGNIFTKVGDGTSIAAMIGGGNIFTHVGEGDAWALMGGLGNVFTKVGDGNALALMVAAANVYTHVGDGMSVALMVARGNIATKVGNGMMLAAMVGDANILTHVGDGNTFAAMIGQANVLTKVGDDLTAALMLGRANIYTHVGDGTSIGLFAGEVNVMTKVGDGTTLAAMFGRANIMTHVGDGLTGVLALGEANIVTKVGDDFMGVVAAAKANVVTHVGDSTTAAVLAGKGNILTKVGDGTTVGLLISDIGNIMTHVGDGASIGFAKGKANIITKVGDGLGINAAWGKANIFTHVGDGDRYNFAKGDANIITKVGDGQEVAVVHGKANIITHVGDGDDYTGAWGKANIITKVGDGRSVVLAKGDANIVTQVGDGDGYNALWSKANIVTKVGDGIQVTAAKGKANITTTVGDGLNVTAAYGDANINTKVGDGVSVSLAWGKYNINTKVGDGLNVAVMKGKANVNVHVGDGMGINASYARNNVAIKVGNGDFYSLAVASSNTKSNKLSSLFETIKQTVLGVGGSQAINYLVQGSDASSSGSQKGRGAIATPEVTRLEGFQMDEIDEIGSDLGDSLSAGVTDVETPDLGKMQDELNVDSSDESPSQNPNLIANGGFEQGEQGWSSTHGIEASYNAGTYGVSNEGHGSRVSELDTHTNTSIYQDISSLSDGEVVALSFDFAKRAGISSNEGIEVLWNGDLVFSSSGDDTTWQQKTLKLTAQGGSNRIEFKGTGQSDGLGYVLDNVVARSEKSQQASAVSDNAQQNQATQNAMSDKERAEADRQRLEQEREQQLAAVSGTQSQLEATDQQALETNGQAQREAVKQESDEVTAELTAMAQGLDALDEHAQYQGASGNGWREHFAGNLFDDVQDRVEDAKAESGEHLSDAQRTYSDNQQDVKDAVAKSEAGVAKGEQNQAGAQRDIDKAEADAEVRKSEALSSQQDAQRAQEQANSASSDAESRGERDASAANNKANQAKSDAKGAKQNEGDKPNRRGASGSGLSGEAHEVRGAGDTSSHINAESQAQADGRYSEGLQEDELQALEGATQAVNRLQINAGVRKSNTGASISSLFAGDGSEQIRVPQTQGSNEVQREEMRATRVNLQSLGEVRSNALQALARQDSELEVGDTLSFDKLETTLNVSVQAGDEGFALTDNSGSSDKVKTLILENPNDGEQVQSLARFILDNYTSFEQIPSALALTDDSVMSYENGRPQLLAKRSDEQWQSTAQAELMSVDELKQAAYVKGKPRGKSYQKVLKALQEYHEVAGDANSGQAQRLSKLTSLSSLLEGYLLGHPDSGRVPALNELLVDVDTRVYHMIEETAAFTLSDESGIKGEARNQQYNAIADALNAYQPADLRSTNETELKTIRRFLAIVSQVATADPELSLQQRLAQQESADELPSMQGYLANYLQTHPDGALVAVLKPVLDEVSVWLENPDALASESYSRVRTQFIQYAKLRERLDSVEELVNLSGELLDDPSIDPLSDLQSALGSEEELKLLDKQVQEYLTQFPDASNAPAVQQVLSQLHTWMDEKATLSLASQTVQQRGSFSQLYNKLSNANLKDATPLSVNSFGDWSVASGNGAAQQGGESAVQALKKAVTAEYGEAVTQQVFDGLSAQDLSKTGVGVDANGLKNVHLAIERQQSPVSATLYIWKPSSHSTLGHAAMQIGQGRNQVKGDEAHKVNQSNYVSWWPLGQKSSRVRRLFDIATEEHPDLSIRWSDFSQPANQNKTLETDMSSEENDGFGMTPADQTLDHFLEVMEDAKGLDSSFENLDANMAATFLSNPGMLEQAGVPEKVYLPYVKAMENTDEDMLDVGQRFADALRLAVEESNEPGAFEAKIANELSKLADAAINSINTFKSEPGDEGRVFRINLEGLDVAAMQAEWAEISQDPDARYQLLTKNCSTIVARVLKAGGADKLIGHNWMPKFGVWTPTSLYNYGQALQEAQAKILAKKRSHTPEGELKALSGKDSQSDATAADDPLSKGIERAKTRGVHGKKVELSFAQEHAFELFFDRDDPQLVIGLREPWGRSTSEDKLAQHFAEWTNKVTLSAATREAKDTGLYGVRPSPEDVNKYKESLVLDGEGRIRGLHQALDNQAVEALKLPEQRAKETGLYGVSISPDVADKYLDKVIFDGFGRVQGIRENLSEVDVETLNTSKTRSLNKVSAENGRDLIFTERESLLIFADELSLVSSETTRELARHARRLWSSSVVNRENTQSFFADAASKLDDYPALKQLASAFEAQSGEDKPYTQRFDNMFGRQYETALGQALLEQPPQAVLDAAKQMGGLLYEDISRALLDWKRDVASSFITSTADEAMDKQLVQIAEAIQSDYRPWFARLPAMSAFLESPTMDNFKSMLTQVDTGHEAISIPLLAVKFTTVLEDSSIANNVLKESAWFREANSFFKDALLPRRSGTNTLHSSDQDGTKINVELPKRPTDQLGSKLPHQPENPEGGEPGQGRHVPTSARIIDPDSASDFEKQALNQGMGIVSGISGSTNVAYAYARHVESRVPGYSAQVGFLNTMMLMLADGGHSFHEVMTVYKAWQESNPDDQNAILDSFISKYSDLSELHGVDSKAIEQAMDKAFDKTLAFYREHGYANLRGHELIANQLDAYADGKKVMVFSGFSGLGYQDPDALREKISDLIDREIATQGDASRLLIVAGATPEGIGLVYDVAEEKGVKAIGIVSEEGRPYARQDIDVVYVPDPQGSWKVESPSGDSYMVSVAKQNGTYIALGGGDVAVSEIKDAIAQGVDILIDDSFVPNENKVREKEASKGKSIDATPLKSWVDRLVLASGATGLDKSAAPLAIVNNQLMHGDRVLSSNVSNLLPALASDASARFVGANHKDLISVAEFKSQAKKSTDALPGVSTDSYNQVLDALASYHQLHDVQKASDLGLAQLMTLNDVVRDYIQRKPESRRAAMDSLLLQTRERSSLLLDQGMLGNSQADVPKTLHFMWLGKLGDIQKEYIQAWGQTNMAGQKQGYQVKIWYNPQAHLAYELGKQVKAKARGEGLSGDDYANRVIGLQNEAYAVIREQMAQGKDFDAAAKTLLVAQYGQTQVYLEQVIADNQKSYEDFIRTSGDGYVLADINTLLEQPGAIGKDLYYQELGLRQNLSATSDFVRMNALKSEGGLYFDVDFLPELRSDLFDSNADLKALIERSVSSSHSGRDTLLPEKYNLLVTQLVLEKFAADFPGRLNAYQKGAYSDAIGDALASPELVPLVEGIRNHLADMDGDLSQVFKPLGDLQVVPGGTITGQYRGTLSSAGLASVPDSGAINQSIAYVKALYAALDESGLVHSQSVDDVSSREKFDQFEQRLLAYYQSQGSSRDYLTAQLGAATYRFDGIKPGSDASIHTAGPGAVTEGGKLQFERYFVVDEMQGLFNHFNQAFERFNPNTEEELKSSWVASSQDIDPQPQVNTAGNSDSEPEVATKANTSYVMENDGTPPKDKASRSPLTRFLNDELFGAKSERREIGDVTRMILTRAEQEGSSHKVTLRGDAGRLTGYYHQGQPQEGQAAANKVVLFLHGSGSSAEEQASGIRNHYQKQGIDMLAVNMRGYGESDGGPDEKGLYQDARTMFNYLVNDKGVDPANIIIHGYSMGGPIAADLARFAAQSGTPVSGLLLDRPMPSMSKAITAHEVANPGGVVGALSKAVNGQFSVEKNLNGLPKDTRIMLLTDNEGLGNEGEKLRTRLSDAGFQVSGEQTYYAHEASHRLMGEFAEKIATHFTGTSELSPEGELEGLGRKFKGPKLTLEPKKEEAPIDASTKLTQNKQAIIEQMKQSERVEFTDFNGAPDYQAFQEIGFERVSANGFDLTNPLENVFLIASRSESKASGEFVGDKLHISVDSNKIAQAYEVLKPLLLSEQSPIDKWKVTDVSRTAGAESRVTQGAQFTLYIKPDSQEAGYQGQSIKRVQQLVQEVENRLLSAGIAPGTKPNSDVSAAHWQFVSYRNENRSDREGSEAQSARLREETYFQLISDPELAGLSHKGLNRVGEVKNRNLDTWQELTVTQRNDGGDTRYDGQLIIQTEDDPIAAEAAVKLAGKHPDSSVVVQLDADGNYRVVYGDPAKLNGKLRWQLVGHGRDGSASNNTTLGGHTATELATKLANFSQALSREHGASMNPAHISVVGCSLVSQDHQQGFGHGFIRAMAEQGIRSSVSARTSELAVDNAGRKFTRNGQNEWKHKLQPTKVVLSWNEQGEVVTREEAIRNGVAEGDIEISRVGQAAEASKASGAIADNSEVFSAPEKRKNTQAVASSGAKSSNKLSYSGNIQVNVGDGEFTAVNWGTSNLGIKVGTGGFKSLAFGDNNVMVHIGDGDSKHSFDMAGYQALEGAQMFIGTRNVSFNMGRSNDLLVMMDKSIPTPPLVNPFDGAARISSVLTEIATSGDDGDWLAAQQAQWTLSGAKKYLADMSGLDQSSSVDYTSLTDLDSHNERSSRGLKHDVEAALNKQYNQWLGSNDNDQSKGNKSRADKFREANDKLAFNFAVGGRGADIQVTTGSWNFMFGDNIQSILDTNLGSLFGLMTQQFSSTGQAKTTFTYNPQDLPRQLKNKLLGKMAGVGADTTLGDIFGVDYTAAGSIVSRQGEPVDGVAILTEMLEVIAEFGGDQLQAFTDPAKLLDGLKAGLDTGGDAITSFAESHGLKDKAPDEEEDASSVVVDQGESSAGVESVDAPEQQRAFGFNSLNLPNLFATIFSKDKQDEMKSLVTNLKQNLTADLLNMKEKTFDFLRNSGHLKGDGDLHVSLGNYNFNWGGDGKDLGAYLGDNNNFWGGRGDDVYYATGTSNVFTGGEGDDMGVLMGRENMMFGGEGNDTAVVAGRINHVFMGAGDDQSFVFGEGGEIDAGSGRDYVVTSGNFNRVDTGEDQDYAVTIGNNNRAELGGGDDFANVFGNYNRIDGSAGKDVIKLMGYSAVLNGGQDDDHLIAAAISKFSELDGGDGNDLIVLGGYENRFSGGAGVDSFVVNGDIINNTVSDISSEDKIVFDGLNWQNIWFERSGYDLSLSILRQPGSDSDQEKFESVGNVVFSDYFKDNRAELVIDMGNKDTAGERDYLALSRSSVDALVQAMSGFAPQAGDTGLLSKLDNQSRLDVTAAWSDVVSNKGSIA